MTMMTDSAPEESMSSGWSGESRLNHTSRWNVTEAWRLASKVFDFHLNTTMLNTKQTKTYGFD